MVSILSSCGVWNGGGVCCCWPALSGGGAVVRSSQCSAAEYCGRVVHCVLPGVWCVVCVSLSRSLCGGVSSVRSPLVVVVGGAIVDGGWHCVVVWHGDEGRVL